jgi:adenylate cyclase
MKSLLFFPEINEMNVRPVFMMLLAAFLFQKSYAQTREIDSLNHILKSTNPGDKKVDILTNLALSWSDINKDSSISLYEQAKALAVKSHYRSGLARAATSVASLYFDKSQFFLARENLDLALSVYIELNDLESEADVYKSIGDLNGNAGLYDYPKSLEAYNEAFLIYKKLDKLDKMANVLSARGTLYNFINDAGKSVEYLSQALKIYITLHDSANIASCYLEIGRTQAWHDHYELAIQNIENAMRVYRLLHEESSINMCDFMIGVANMNAGRYTEAIPHFSSSLVFMLRNGDLHNISICYSFLGRCCNARKEYSIAVAYIEKAVSCAQKNNDLNAACTAYNELSNAYSGVGNYESALNAFRYFKVLNDSMVNSEKAKDLVRKEMQFDFSQKELIARSEQEKKDAMISAETKKQRLIRNSVSGGFGVVLLFSIVVFRQRNRISREKHRSEELLLNILPHETAEELKEKGSANARQFDEVTVMFTDFKNFTQASEKLSAVELVNEIHHCYSAFDKIISKYNLEKIKTIGDSYMCAGGLPVPNITHAEDMAHAALEIRGFMKAEKLLHDEAGKPFFEIRIGLHTGPVVAGIVGIKKFAYDIWGDTVNLASRMESSGESGKVNISASTYELVKNKFKCEHRGKISAKNKGEIDMYFINYQNSNE